ncbi:MAG: SymE family type I addiction module toxin [Chitinophagaceae bacterium]
MKTSTLLPVALNCPDKETTSRTLKVQQLIRSTRWDHTKVPEIRLSGAWLEKFGFYSGQHIEVYTMQGKLVLMPKT